MPTMGFLVVFIGVIIVVAYVSNSDTPGKIEKKEKDFKMKNQLPENSKTYKYIRGFPAISNNSDVIIWNDSEKLYIFHDENRDNIEISLNDINYYAIKGDLGQEFISNGKKVSAIDSAITEGIFGTAAAMKQNQSAPIIKNIDERKTIINATVNKKETFIFFEGAELYNYLLENIPEKEQSFVAMSK